MERFGSIETIIDTIYELPENTKVDGKCFLDTRNMYVKMGYENRKSLPVQYRDMARESVTNIECLPEFSGMKFEYNGFVFQTPLL